MNVSSGRQMQMGDERKLAAVPDQALLNGMCA